MVEQSEETVVLIDGGGDDDDDDSSVSSFALVELNLYHEMDEWIFDCWMVEVGYQYQRRIPYSRVDELP